MRNGDVPKRQRFLVGPMSPPEVVDAVDEELGRNLGLLLAPKGVDDLAFARSVQLPLSRPLDKFQLNEWAVQVVLLDVALAAARWDISVEEHIEVLF